MLCAVLTIFLGALGACIGSFLNVVVYRLPRGLSVSQPRRSFCPSCEKQIEWYDNIPIASWIALKGRCRNCGLPISLQYPLVESSGVIVTMVVWEAVRSPRAGDPFDLWWPVLLGMLGLFWCLLALSAMDLKEYYVDIRLTWLALALGLGCHAISPARVWPSMEYVSAPWAAFAFGCTVVLLVLHWLWPMPEEQPITEETAEQAPQEAATAKISNAKPRAGHVVMVSLLAVIAAAAVAIEVMACYLEVDPVPAQLLTGLGLATLFGSILAASWLPTEADEAIAQAVENERSQAVRQAAKESLILLACVAVGLGSIWLVHREPVSRLWLSFYRWTPSSTWQPVAGLATALFGWVVAGGTCWLVRVLFTLLLRKEALGFGDIHIIAAVGAVMGPHLAIAGFFLAAPVALLGTLVLVFRKRYRTLPFGPWLSLGFLLALLWGGDLVNYINNGLGGLHLLLQR